MGKYKKELQNRRQDFLLSFFEEDRYKEKQVNGFFLVKHWNGNAKKYEVSIYNKRSFENYKSIGKSY